MVQKPFYPEDGCCHIYLLHPPGGLVGGDQLEVRIEAGPGTGTLITTPAATKFYRSNGAVAAMRQCLRVAPGASMEWLPQENILFGGSQSMNETEVHLRGDARYIGWEMTCLGRPASGDAFARGHGSQRFDLWRDERLLLSERQLLEAGSRILMAPWGMAGHTVVANLIATPADRDTVTMLNAALPAGDGSLNAFTCIGDVLIGRWLGNQAEQGRQWLARVWSLLRPRIIACRACPPRIWRT